MLRTPFFLAFISESIRTSSDSHCRAVKAKAHKVKGIGTSMLFSKTFAVQQALRADTWVIQMMFTSYLRDITHESMDTFSW